MANLLVPMTSDQDLAAEFFNDSIDNTRMVAYQTADQTVNNTTTYLESTDLVIPVTADASYILESCFFYDTNSTADIKIRIRCPTVTGISLVAPWSSGTAITGVTNNINQQGSGPPVTDFEMPCGGVSAGTVLSIRPAGWIEIFTGSGNITVAFAQNTANVSNTILKQGSWLALSRVS